MSIVISGGNAISSQKSSLRFIAGKKIDEWEKYIIRRQLCFKKNK